MRFSEETRKRMSEAAKRRWAARSLEERELVRKEHSESMKLYWASKTPEERREHARKIAASRKARKENRSDKRNL